MTLTADTLRDTLRMMRDADALMSAGRNPTWIAGPMPFNGMRIIEDQFCLEKTNERTFPISRHRSARIHKKLIRRFGGEFKMKPAMFIVGNTILAHPVLWRKRHKI